MTSSASAVLTLLRDCAVGRANAITIDAIRARLGLSRRIVERATEEIREGSLDDVLCSETRTDPEAGIKPGLYLAENFDDVERHYRQIAHRSKMMYIHMANMRKAALNKWGAKYGRQLDMFDSFREVAA